MHNDSLCVETSCLFGSQLSRVFFVHGLQRASSLERASRGGAKRTTLCAVHHEERESDGAAAPPRGDHRVHFHRCVALAWYNPSGAAMVTCLHAAARTRRAAPAVQGDVVSVWQVLQGTPSVLLISAQRVAQCDDHCTSNLFINNKLRQRYSRSTTNHYQVTYDHPLPRPLAQSREGPVPSAAALAVRPHSPPTPQHMRKQTRHGKLHEKIAQNRYNT